jgi:hypothetical protein
MITYQKELCFRKKNTLFVLSPLDLYFSILMVHSQVNATFLFCFFLPFYIGTSGLTFYGIKTIGKLLRELFPFNFCCFDIVKI